MSVLNVSLVRDYTEDATLKIVPCFIIIEDIKGQLIYVSETQGGSYLTIQFDELPRLPYAISSIHLKIVGKLPSRILQNPTSEVWAVIADYTVDFNNLIKIQPEDTDQSFEGINVPLFEFYDGNYVLKNAVRSNRQYTKTAPVSKSFTYNSLLKLNKILEYITQIKQELMELTSKLNTLVQDKPQYCNNEVKAQACHQLRKQINEKEAKIITLTGSLDRNSAFAQNNTNEPKMNDEYGVIYSDFSNVRHRLHSYQLRKFQQLIKIFEQTSLFSSNGYIISDQTDTSIYCLSLKIVKAELIIQSRSWEEENTILGFYLLFVYLLAKKILYIPLPHSLSFYGSTSLVDGQLPLYLIASPSQQHFNNFEVAVKNFNSNLMQVRQYLEHHR